MFIQQNIQINVSFRRPVLELLIVNFKSIMITTGYQGIIKNGRNKKLIFHGQGKRFGP